MKAGTILLHRNFVFEDGSTRDKYLVVLGARDQIVLVAKTTSNGARYRNDHGCQSANQFPAFLLTAGCCCLPRSSWVCLGDFYELDSNALVGGITAGNIYRVGELTDELTRDLQFCAKNSDDISSHQESIVDASLAPA